jgi:hypothetical protein
LTIVGRGGAGRGGAEFSFHPAQTVPQRAFGHDGEHMRPVEMIATRPIVRGRRSPPPRGCDRGTGFTRGRLFFASTRRKARIQFSLIGQRSPEPKRDSMQALESSFKKGGWIATECRSAGHWWRRPPRKLGFGILVSSLGRRRVWPNAAGLGPHPLRRGESGPRFAPRSQHLGKLRAIEEWRRRLAARL